MSLYLKIGFVGALNQLYGEDQRQFLVEETPRKEQLYLKMKETGRVKACKRTALVLSQHGLFGS